MTNHAHLLTQATPLLLWGIVLHFVADWWLQNEWMALNKTSLTHPAAWVHSGIQIVAMLAIFPPVAALALGAAHILIDTRKPLIWWRKIYRQTKEGPAFISFAMWQDQAAHVMCLAVASLAVYAT